MNSGQRQFALDILKTPKPSLQNFIVPESLNLRLVSLTDALKTITHAWESKTPIPAGFAWIYCWGPEGSGKTHLLRAMANEAEKWGEKFIYLHPSDQANWERVEQHVDQLPNVILIDDVDTLSESQQSTVFRIQIEAKARPSLFLFLTGKSSIAGLTLRDDVKSRLGSGMNFELSTLSDNEKILAIHQAAKDRGITLSSDVPPWLLSNFHRDLPSLLSLIEALDQFALEKKRAITLPLLREFLQSPLF